MRFRRLWLLLPFGALAALLLTMSAGAAGSQTFTDPAGDAGAAPDVTTVVVSNDDSGVLTFAITLANPAVLSGENDVIVFINSDRNASTGFPQGGGSDYAIDILATGAGLFRWSGTQFEPVSGSTLRPTSATTFTLSNRDMNGTTAFDFFLAAFGPMDSADFAPDATTPWSYTLNLRPELESARATFRPGIPRAGRVFSVTGVTIELGTGQMVRPTAFRCAARLAGRTLRPTARCRWLIPRNAAGKALVVTVTASYQGVTETFIFRAIRVRR